jgi:dihydrofolate reductase
MNKAKKIVFSNTLDSTDWQNTTLIKGDMIAAMKKLKQSDGKDMVILGSGKVVSQLASHNLIDCYQLLITPVILREGTPLFQNINSRLNLKLTNTRTFNNGNVVLYYDKQ